MVSRKGQYDAEGIATAVILGAIIIFFLYTLLSTGILSDIMNSFSSAFGPIGILIGLLFIAMAVIAIINNLK